MCVYVCVLAKIRHRHITKQYVGNIIMTHWYRVRRMFSSACTFVGLVELVSVGHWPCNTARVSWLIAVPKKNGTVYGLWRTTTRKKWFSNTHYACCKLHSYWPFCDFIVNFELINSNLTKITLDSKFLLCFVRFMSTHQAP